jgi:hypothetical protein
MAGVNIADGHHLAMTKSVYVQNTHILDDRHTVHYCSGQKTYIFLGPDPCVSTSKVADHQSSTDRRSMPSLWLEDIHNRALNSFPVMSHAELVKVCSSLWGLCSSVVFLTTRRLIGGGGGCHLRGLISPCKNSLSCFTFVHLSSWSTARTRLI